MPPHPACLSNARVCGEVVDGYLAWHPAAQLVEAVRQALTVKGVRVVEVEVGHVGHLGGLEHAVERVLAVTGGRVWGGGVWGGKGGMST